MTVLYLLSFQELTNCKSEQLSDAGNLFELLKILSDQYGGKFKKAVFNLEGSDLGDDVVILVNGKNVALSEGIKTTLSEEDTVAVIPMVMGG
jgi:molybdopterin synthase sulfur carrier subunit